MYAFYIGFILSVIGFLVVVKKTFDSRNVLSPQMFVFAGILLYLYIPAVANNYPYINNEIYNFAILFGALGCIVSSFMFRYNIIDDVKCPEYVPNEKFFKLLAYAFIIFLISEIINRILSAGSIIAVFVQNRLSDYLGEGLTENTSPLRSLFTEGLRIAFYFYIDMLFCKGKKKLAILLFIVPLIHHLFTAVTRFDFVAMVGALVIYLVNRKLMYVKSDGAGHTLVQKRHLNFFKIIMFSFVGVYFALLFMRYANLARHGVQEGMADLSYVGLFLQTFSDDSQYYEFFYDLYETLQNGDMNFEYGMAWFIAPFVTFIPRAIWPDKPYTSFSVRGTEAVYYDYTSGQPVCTFTIFGEGYGQFGAIGCFLAPIIFLAARWITFKQAKYIKYNQLYVLIVMFSLFTFMRAEAPIFHALLDALWLVLFRKYLCKPNPELAN